VGIGHDTGHWTLDRSVAEYDSRMMYVHMHCIHGLLSRVLCVVAVETSTDTCAYSCAV